MEVARLIQKRSPSAGSNYSSNAVRHCLWGPVPRSCYHISFLIQGGFSNQVCSSMHYRKKVCMLRKRMKFFRIMPWYAGIQRR